jgi:hypothetical protein
MFKALKLSTSALRRCISHMSSKSALSSLNPAYYCQSCGRHTSSRSTPAHLQIPTETVNSTPKHCSQRCKTDGRPSPIIALIWSRLLDGYIVDEPTLAGLTLSQPEQSTKKAVAISCSQVQGAIFDPTTGLYRSSTTVASTPIDSQSLGMVNAQNREMIRRSARLLYHFGFGHFTTLKRSKSRGIFGLSGDDEQSLVEMFQGERREVVAVDETGRGLTDVTSAKGEWGLKWKDR